MRAGRAITAVQKTWGKRGRQLPGKSHCQSAKDFNPHVFGCVSAAVRVALPQPDHRTSAHWAAVPGFDRRVARESCSAGKIPPICPDPR